MKKVAMIIDIVNSKKVKNRYEIQSDLKICVNYLNEVFRQELTAQVMFSGGDELQGLFNTKQGAMLYFRMLQLLMAPLMFRAGIGYGEIIYHEGWLSTELDGKAYHFARNAIEQATKIGEINVVYLEDNYNYAQEVNTLNYPIGLLNYLNLAKYSDLLLVTEFMQPLKIEGMQDYGVHIKQLQSILTKKNIAIEKLMPYMHQSEIRLDQLQDLNFKSLSLKGKGYSDKLADIFSTSAQNITKKMSANALYDMRVVEIINIYKIIRLGERE